MFRPYVLVAIGVACAVLTSVSGAEQPAADRVSSETLLSEANEIPGGFCVVAGCTNAQLAISLGDHDKFVVQALFPEASDLQQAREAIRACGVYGRVSAVLAPRQRLPYAENLINVVVVERFRDCAADGLSLAEIHRVLTPLGVVFLGVATGDDLELSDSVAAFRAQAEAAGFADIRLVQHAGSWIRASKPWPPDIDEWPHYLHAADGNPVANDRVVGPPEQYQWVADPVWAQSHETDSNLRCLVTARGRIYYLVNEAPTSLAGPESPPDKWFLTARDAFNGVTTLESAHPGMGLARVEAVVVHTASRRDSDQPRQTTGGGGRAALRHVGLPSAGQPDRRTNRERAQDVRRHGAALRRSWSTTANSS